MEIEPVIPRPIPRQGSVATPIFPEHTVVSPVALGRGDSRSDRIDEMPLANQAGVGSMAAIEGDALPIHKLAGRCRSHPQRVLIVDHPSTPLADAAGPFVETNGDALLSDISGCHLKGPKERRAEIHPQIRRRRPIFHFDRSPCESLGQRVQQSGRHGNKLTGIVRPQEGLPDVLNNTVLLGGGVLVLRHHLPITMGQGMEH